MPQAGSQLAFSTNWKPACVWSNFAHSTRDSANTIRLVHSAAQRALDATVASSPRTDMITAPPTSGSQVSRDSRGKPASFMGSPENQEDADQHDDADQH